MINEFYYDGFQNKPIPFFSFTGNQSLEESVIFTKQVTRKKHIMKEI